MNPPFINQYVNCSGKINNIPQTNLFITDQYGVSDLSQLRHYNISHVFNVAPGAVVEEHPGINYYHLPISDDAQQNILQYFDKVFLKIDEITNNRQNIVINCHAGVSRSASFIIGYLIRRGLTFENSYQLVKSCRSIISPNKGFVEQLKYYERTIGQIGSS
jgi:protein-tyrosine phosphatase